MSAIKRLRYFKNLILKLFILKILQYIHYLNVDQLLNFKKLLYFRVLKLQMLVIIIFETFSGLNDLKIDSNSAKYHKRQIKNLEMNLQSPRK